MLYDRVASEKQVYVATNAEISFFFELFRRFDFDCRRRGIFFLNDSSFWCSKFNYMQRDCTCACDLACLHLHNSISNVAVSVTIHDHIYTWIYLQICTCIFFLDILINGYMDMDMCICMCVCICVYMCVCVLCLVPCSGVQWWTKLEAQRQEKLWWSSATHVPIGCYCWVWGRKTNPTSSHLVPSNVSVRRTGA